MHTLCSVLCVCLKTEKLIFDSVEAYCQLSTFSILMAGCLRVYSFFRIRCLYVWSVTAIQFDCVCTCTSLSACACVSNHTFYKLFLNTNMSLLHRMQQYTNTCVRVVKAFGCQTLWEIDFSKLRLVFNRWRCQNSKNLFASTARFGIELKSNIELFKWKNGNILMWRENSW